MNFVGQFLLSELPQVDGQLPLPSTGYLYFFFSDDDLHSCHVIWRSEVSGLTEIPAPPRPEPEPAKGLKKLLGIKPKPPRFEIYRKQSVGFQEVRTFPPAESEIVESILKDDDCEELINLSESLYSGLPAHHFFGHPEPVQGNDMEFQCEVETAGSHLGPSEAYTDPKILAAAKDWRLLLQLDEDRATGFTFVDAGKLYFWIRTQDAANNDLSRVHVVCQFG